ncbi:hypothetical protein ABL78_2102 [Leptomonas seymouri]|uniref:Uncharacterized protein n=1 Tax=Leptomonas seymouri TaxID=5684 RepID=A0A0N0P7V0_LEPSE|nr:hypothetical protein ABL78_2102 [Leptomonas seymouri]|eukprot:KPI88787.1 hypothetical protein ABL78_2102 [Leptomonas seymouri]
MDRLHINEPLKALAPLQVNTPAPHGPASGTRGRSAMRGKESKLQKPHVIRINNGATQPERQATSTKPSAPSAGAKAELVAAPAHRLRCTVPQGPAFLHGERPAASAEATIADAVNESGKLKEGINEEDDGRIESAAAAPSEHPPADASHVVFVQPPSSAKPQIPSRRTSMARLRKQQRQLKSAIEKEDAMDAPAASVPISETDLNGIPSITSLRHGLQIFSYRPSLACPNSNSMWPAAEGDRDVPEAPDQLADERSKNETGCAPGSARILPRGLRSPSGGTELSAAPEESADDNTSEDFSDTYNGHHDSGGYTAFQPRRSRAPRVSIEVAASLPSHDTLQSIKNGPAAAAMPPESNATFHALQFLSPPRHDRFLLPLLSGRSQLGNEDSRSDTDGGDAVGSDSGKPTRTSQRSEERHRVQSILMSPRAQRSADADANVEDDDELIVCPFALFGCCPRGTHTAVEVQQNAMLHYHLVAVAGCLRRTKARQQQLEHNIILLQNQMHTQASALHKTREQLEHFKRLCRRERKREATLQKNSPVWVLEQQQQRPVSRRAGDMRRSVDDEGVCASLTAADASLSNNTVESAKVADDPPHERCGGATHKSFPGDVSLHEPQVTDYGIDEEEEDICVTGVDDDAPIENQREAGEGTYARQLRQRTHSAKQLYALRDSPEEKGRGSEGKHCHVESAAPEAASIEALRSSETRAVSAQPRARNSKSELRQWTCKCSSAAVSMKGTRKDVKRCPSAATPTKSSYCIGPPSPYDVQHGAGGSTEVSGMSNVPPYQLPSESVSTICSASFDLDDHEDDTDVGEMRQQLLHLATGAAKSPLSPASTGESKEAIKTEKHQQRPNEGCRTVDEHSARSIPSLVSNTYRPSQLAHAPAVPPAVSRAEGAAESAPMTAPSLPLAAAHSDHRRVEGEEVDTAVGHEQGLLPVEEAVICTAGDSVRLAAPLQRPTLIRKGDVMQDKERSKAPMIAPSAIIHTTTVALTASHRDSAARPTPTAGIMSKAGALQPRRLSELDSDGARVKATVINEVVTCEKGTAAPKRNSVIATQRAPGDGAAVQADGSSLGSPQSTSPVLFKSRSRRHSSFNSGTWQSVAHPHSSHVEENSNDYLESHSTLAVPRKRSTSRPEKEGSSKRSSLSRSRRGSATSATRRPQHATSLLSTKEAVELGETAHLGLPSAE